MKACRPSSALLSQLAQSTRARQPLSSRINAANQNRTFNISNPFQPEIQSLTATRTVSYPAEAIYAVVADVGHYSQFLPFCRTSEVTKTSSEDANGKTWPEEAKLVVGWNDGISETFWSRVYCDGKTMVEAVSGETETSLGRDSIKHHSARPESGDPTRNATVLTHLLTKWTLRPFPFKPAPIKSGEGPQDTTSDLPSKEQTEVNLSIEYQFANPVYAAMSAAVAPKVAGYMMEAFEKRLQSLMDQPASKVGALDGVLRPRGDSL